MPRKKTNDVFLKELEIKNPYIKALESYVNSSTKIQFECLMCGNKWFAAPGHILLGEGCPVCARKRVGNRNRLSEEQFKHRLSTIQSDIEAVGLYKNSQTK